MKLSSPLIEIVAAVVMLASAAQSAQRANVPGSSTEVRKPPQFNAYNVTPSRPFGKIDVTRAGTSVETVRLWSFGRSVVERNELKGRCAYITTPANAARYAPSDQEFCRNYALAGFAGSVRPHS